MKNRKQLLADFYLELLAIPDPDVRFRGLKDIVCGLLAIELETDSETIQTIFERMAEEDK